jgi:iron-sulfur cluster assembly accessory protein
VRLSITEIAAKAVLARARDADVSGWLLRVAVVAGGCNGLTYELYFVPEPGPDDAVVEAGPLRVVIDKNSALLVEGMEIDLPAKSQSFRFHNPRARKACSCGASFEV